MRADRVKGARVAAALRIVGLALVAGVLRAGAAGAQVSPGPLATAHAEYDGTLGCTKCHGGRKESVAQRCVACHREVDWSIRQGVGLHTAETRETCGSCHPDHAGRGFALIRWPDGSEKNFDHRRTGWALEGEHADLACAKCHTTKFRTAASAALSPRRNGAGWMGLERDCASCHEDVHRGALEGACVRCHDAKDWKAAPKFDHASTRYPLTGEHRDVACAKCHARTGAQAAGVRLAGDARPAPAGDTVMVYRPIPFRDCASCHADPHGGRLRGACRDCHDTRSFASRNARGFDHGRTRYPLRGEHVDVECAACHGPANGPRHVARPAFASCGSCHNDSHAGTATIAGRRADCAACHGVEGFARATFTVAQHQRTGYPLDGAHQTVRCAACHTTAAQGSAARPAATATPVVLRMRPAHQACASCHSDAHGAQMAALRTRGAAAAACESCHAVAGWKYSRYPRAEHARTGLALDGRHAEVACARCHAVERAGLARPASAALAGRGGVVFRTGEKECAACHVDVHDGRLRGDARGCAECHDARAWRPSQMAAAKHSTFAFVLDGAHLATPCNACHTTLGRAAARGTLRLSRPAPAPLSLRVADARRCASCHTESPHGKQFAARADRGACEACHVTASFTPASRFDHRDTEFPLTGGHAGVACDRCHRPAGTGTGARAFQYAISTSCESCHTPKQGERR